MQNTYHPQTAEFIATVCQNMPELSSDVMQGWIENPKILQKVLCEALCPSVIASELEVWKTVKLGLHKSADEYRQALKAKGNCVSDLANDILGEPAFAVAAEEREYDLVVVSNAELGYSDGTMVKQTLVLDRAKELGLELCLAEVGPALREQYQNQPMGEWLQVAMEPIADSGGRLHVLHIVRLDRDLWLLASDDHPARLWRAHDRCVFVRPRK